MADNKKKQNSLNSNLITNWEKARLSNLQNDINEQKQPGFLSKIGDILSDIGIIPKTYTPANITLAEEEQRLSMLKKALQYNNIIPNDVSSLERLSKNYNNLLKGKIVYTDMIPRVSLKGEQFLDEKSNQVEYTPQEVRASLTLANDSPTQSYNDWINNLKTISTSTQTGKEVPEAKKYFSPIIEALAPYLSSETRFPQLFGKTAVINRKKINNSHNAFMYDAFVKDDGTVGIIKTGFSIDGRYIPKKYDSPTMSYDLPSKPNSTVAHELLHGTKRADNVPKFAKEKLVNSNYSRRMKDIYSTNSIAQMEMVNTLLTHYIGGGNKIPWKNNSDLYTIFQSDSSKVFPGGTLIPGSQDFNKNKYTWYNKMVLGR